MCCRFERILDLMQQMQECGQPPKDIVGDMVSSAFVPWDQSCVASLAVSEPVLVLE